MKSLILFTILFFAFANAFAQPDPRDSVILESKTVTQGAGAPFVTVKVWITNKDSLVFLTLSLAEKSDYTGAYGILSRHSSGSFTFGSVITNLTPSFRYGKAANFSRYNSTSPDSFLVGAGWDPGIGDISIEPPNASRKAVWEIKFDTIYNRWGSFQLDSCTLNGLGVTFTNTVPQDMPANFVKGVIYVYPTPDVRDSIILESKTVVPGAGHPYTTVTVYITNKDSLSYLTLALVEKSTSGGAYATMPRPRVFFGVITPLGPSFRYGAGSNFTRYNSMSPDSFLVGAGFTPTEPSIEPPNATRKAVWLIKFDTVWNNLGTFELDSCTIQGLPKNTFTNTEPRDMPVNFVKSTITVTAPKGDLNQDLALSPADVVWILNCVMLQMPPPGGVSSCDLNCDGMGTPADIVLELNAVFLGEGFPC